MSGRPRGFDEQTVLERAMELFRQEGFAATSLQALLDHMGISRQSLYNAFGDKRTLYLACLDRYAAQRAEELLTELEAPAAGARSVRHFFEKLRDSYGAAGEGSDATSNPCLIGRTCMELGSRDPAVLERVQAHMGRTQRAFEHALTNAVERQEIEACDPGAVARHLTATLHGLGMMRRAGATASELSSAAEVALSVLRPPA